MSSPQPSCGCGDGGWREYILCVRLFLGGVWWPSPPTPPSHCRTSCRGTPPLSSAVSWSSAMYTIFCEASSKSFSFRKYFNLNPHFVTMAGWLLLEEKKERTQERLLCRQQASHGSCTLYRSHGSAAATSGRKVNDLPCLHTVEPSLGK